MEKGSYEELDELLAQVRLLILKVRQSDPTTADELRSLVSQLEFWLESLTVDSLKLKELESARQRVKAQPNGLPKTPNRKQKAR